MNINNNNSQYDSFYRSYPALWFFFSFSIGIIFGWIFLESINFKWLLFALGSLFLLSLISHFRAAEFFPFFIFPFIVLMGSAKLYLALAVFPSNNLSVINLNHVKSFHGWIAEAHYKDNGKHRYVLNCDSVYFDSTAQEASGKIIISQGRFTKKLNYGDVVKVEGKPQPPPLAGNPGEFNYRRYLHLSDIYFQYYLPDDECCTIQNIERGAFWQKNVIVPIRSHIIDKLNQYIPSPAKDVIKALLLGERQDVDPSIKENFQKTGVVHVLAISGLHVGFILFLFILIFSFLRLPYQWKTGLSLFFLFLFVVLVNFKAPVVRASLMAAFYFAGKLSERQSNSLNIIAAAGLLILFFEPQQLLQPGFQFSFAAVGAILYGYPKLSNIFSLPESSNKIAYYFNKLIRQPFLVSAAAVLGTFPLTWLYYGNLQIGALLINILIIPLIGGFVMLSFLFLITASIGFAAAAGLAKLLDYYFIVILKIIEWFSDLPFVQIELPPPTFFILLLAIITVFLIFNLTKRIRLLYLILILFFIFLDCNDWFYSETDRLKVTFVNVGQGDGAILQFPNNDVIVVDAGDKKFKYDSGKRIMLPLLKHYGIKRIKYLLGTHSHSDHIGGFPAIMNNIKVDTLILTAYPGQSKLYKHVLAVAAKKNIPVCYKKRGHTLSVGEKSRVYLLHPDERFVRGNRFSGAELNNSSLVMKVCYGKTSFILTGDLEKSAEGALFNYGGFLNSSVLKVGHHGSKTSTSLKFLDMIDPQYAVVSVGRGNRFFHPSRETIRRLKRNNAHPLRTDHFGALVFESDGQEVRLINWRE